MSFPTSLPSYAGFTSSHTLAADNHAAQSNQEQTDILGIATKMGTGASVPSSGVVLRGNGAGTSTWDTVHLSSDVQGTLGTGNGGTGITSLGAGVATFLGTPSSANLASAVSDETGSGSLVFGVSPTLTTPIIADFANSQHNHSGAAGGGQLTGNTAILAATLKAAQMLNGMVKGRQGGTTGNNAWDTTGTSNTDTSAKDVFLQAGSANSSSAGSVTVTYPTAYSQTPLVFLISVANGGFSMAQVESNSATNFTFSSFSAADARNNNIPTYWLAIGQ